MKVLKCRKKPPLYSMVIVLDLRILGEIIYIYIYISYYFQLANDHKMLKLVILLSGGASWHQYSWNRIILSLISVTSFYASA